MRCQPVTNDVWKSLLTNRDFKSARFSSNTEPAACHAQTNVPILFDVRNVASAPGVSISHYPLRDNKHLRLGQYCFTVVWWEYSPTYCCMKMWTVNKRRLVPVFHVIVHTTKILGSRHRLHIDAMGECRLGVLGPLLSGRLIKSIGARSFNE